jgi:hypothetical protein
LRGKIQKQIPRCVARPRFAWEAESRATPFGMTAFAAAAVTS